MRSAGAHPAGWVLAHAQLRRMTPVSRSSSSRVPHQLTFSATQHSLAAAARWRWAAEMGERRSTVDDGSARHSSGALPRIDTRPNHPRLSDTRLARSGTAGRALVDVRTPEEYRGEVLHMPAYPQEGAQRPGHIPGATSILWHQATRPDGTFKPRSELQNLYVSHDVTPEKQVITYCRTGERSAHTWFALTQLLGTQTFGIMMGHGPSGAAWYERQSPGTATDHQACGASMFDCRRHLQCN